jgi:hypothetical protein
MERCFEWPLRQYLTQRLDRNQTGFVKGMGTSVNILLLTERLRNCKRRDGECCIFINYKSASKKINRRRLYAIMKSKKILPEEDIDILKYMQEALYF